MGGESGCPIALALHGCSSDMIRSLSHESLGAYFAAEMIRCAAGHCSRRTPTLSCKIGGVTGNCVSNHAARIKEAMLFF